MGLASVPPSLPGTAFSFPFNQLSSAHLFKFPPFLPWVSVFNSNKIVLSPLLIFFYKTREMAQSLGVLGVLTEDWV